MRSIAVKLFRHALCIYPYRRELNEAGFFPPIGLEFIAKVVQPFAQGIDIVDLRKEAGRTVDFVRPDTDLICFSVNWNRDGEFLLEEILSAPRGIFTVLGGRHATEDPQRWLVQCPNVSVVVRGDGEVAMEEICRGVPLEKIAGISFRQGDKIIHNPNRELGPILDDIFPDRRLRKYTYDIRAAHAATGVKIDLVAASRGCPFNCTFCTFSRNPWGTKRKWSSRSPESVVAELEQLDATIVCFTDDLFTFDMDRVEKICDLIIAKGLHRKKYVVNARLEIADRRDVMRKMEQAGFSMLMLGIESAHDKTLRSMHKGFDTNAIREYFKVLRKSSMLLHGYFILGAMGESRKDMDQIVPFARELGLDAIALSTLRVAPHSGLEELVAANPGYHVAPGGKVYSDECSVQYLRQMRRRMNREFYGLGQIVKIIRKSLGLGAVSVLLRVIHRLPGLLWHVTGHMLERRKKHRERRDSRSVLGAPPGRAQ